MPYINLNQVRQHTHPVYIRRHLWIIIFGIFLMLFFVLSKSFCADEKWPHREINKTEKNIKNEDCKACHKKVSDQMDQGDEIMDSLIQGYEERCLACHKEIPRICSTITTPTLYKILFIQIPQFPLPLSEGRITCGSCHVIHQKAEGVRLNKEYDTLKGMMETQRINPHKTNVFCFLCHQKEPKDKAQLSMKYGSDTVKLCKECHNNKKARADNHPVNIVPSKDRGITLAVGFPLQEGKMTCLTCHQMKCQGEVQNPFLLRGGPYKTRIEPCLTCHLRDQYVKAIPHDLVTPEGEIKEERCMMCHTLETDEKGQKVLGFKFKAPLRLYCIGCHPVQVQRHPFGANHSNRFVESIWAGMSIVDRLRLSYEQSFKISPLSLSGEITCTTCHNPHDPRKGPKLRINDVNLSCRQCHYKQYGSNFSVFPPSFEFLYRPVQDDLTAKEEDKYPFGYRAALRFYCIGCHPNKDRRHPYGVDHNGRLIVSFWRNIPFEKRVRMAQAETEKILPLTTNGQIACFTCHDPHDGRKGKKLRIEAKDLLCSLCHPDRSGIIEKYEKEKQKN